MNIHTILRSNSLSTSLMTSDVRHLLLYANNPIPTLHRSIRSLLSFPPRLQLRLQPPRPLLPNPQPHKPRRNNSPIKTIPHHTPDRRAIRPAQDGIEDTPATTAVELG